MTSGHFHHIDINSIMLNPTCGSGGAVRAAEPLGSVSRERYVCLTGKNLAGLKRLARKLLFLAPRPSGVF